jgi:hypothetical protein
MSTWQQVDNLEAYTTKKLGISFLVMKNAGNIDAN